MKAVIIGIGDEVLCGDVVNSDAQFLSRELMELGFEILYHKVINDDVYGVKGEIEFALKKADLIITTGGLGPTNDDLTKDAIAKAVSREMVMSEELKSEMIALYTKNNYKITENNYTQCMMIEGSEAVKNDCGTAPGVYLEYENTILVCLPGPPRELIPMYTNYVREKLIDHVDKEFAHKCYMTSGVGESEIEYNIRQHISEEEGYTLNSYINDCGVMIKAVASSNADETATQIIERHEQKLLEVLGESLYAVENLPIWEVVGRLLLEKNITISAAESCTGGLFSAYLSKVSGISKVFNGSLVAYTEEIKKKLLSVKQETLSKHTVYSSEVAMEMAKGVSEMFGTDIGIGVSGICGPGGATKNKPVGLIYFCVYYKGKYKVIENKYSGGRENIQRRCVMSIFSTVQKCIEMQD